MRNLRSIILGLSGAILLGGGVATAQIPDDIRFRIEPARGGEASDVQFTVTYGGGGYHMSSNNRPLADLTGVTRAQLEDGGHIHFKLLRDAGTLDCDGVAAHGEALGACAFIANPGFAKTLAARGAGEATEGQLFGMTLHDVGLAYLDELERQHYATASADDLVRAGEHGVRLAYLKDMGAQGYRGGRLDEVTLARDHGVSPKSIQELRDAGYGSLTLADLVRLRDHGVSGPWLKGVAAAGYAGLAAEQLTRLRDHGVTGEWLAELRDAGYAGLEPAVLTRMRDLGVTGEFARRVTVELGEMPSPEELIQLRMRGLVRGADYRRARQ